MEVDVAASLVGHMRAKVAACKRGLPATTDLPTMQCQLDLYLVSKAFFKIVAMSYKRSNSSVCYLLVEEDLELFLRVRSGKVDHFVVHELLQNYGFPERHFL